MILILDKPATVDLFTCQRVQKMIVCVCNNISDREIRQAADLGLASMDELRRDLGVATCCGQCASYAAEVLATHIDRISASVAVTELSFRSRQAA